MINNHHENLLKNLALKHNFKLFNFYKHLVNLDNSKEYFFVLDGHLNEMGHLEVADMYSK